MINLQEIENINFEKSSFGGYKKESVDEFVDDVKSLVQSLSDTNKDLESKLMLLAEKIEDYRNDEENIRAALLGAQRMGDSVIKEAKAKAENIVKEATIKSEKIISDIRREQASEKLVLTEIKKDVSEFKTKILSLYKSHLESISKIPNYDSEPQQTTLKINTEPETKEQPEQNADSSEKEDVVRNTEVLEKPENSDKSEALEQIESDNNNKEKQEKHTNLEFGDNYNVADNKSR